MALSLRQPSAVRTPGREGVPATAIAVVGKGETGRWCRPATTSASRRTAASRSSISRLTLITGKGGLPGPLSLTG